MLRTLIVDDEPLARDRISTLLSNDDEIEILGECMNGKAAVEMITKHSPDLIFLDIQIPEIDGFQVVEIIGRENMPYTIFITAYKQYVVDALKSCSSNFLLKPFDTNRFLHVLSDAKRMIFSSTKYKVKHR